MPRQRLRADSSSLGWAVARALAALLAVALVYGGLVVLLLTLGISRENLDAISGYRTAYDALAGSTAQDVDGTVRLIAQIAGLVVGVVCSLLVWRALPRAYLARSEVRLANGDRGWLSVSPRAIERAVEGAAIGVPAVTGARGRYGDDRVTVEVTTRNAGEVVNTLAAVRERARESLRDHELPVVPVDCTLTSLERKNRRELA